MSCGEQRECGGDWQDSMLRCLAQIASLVEKLNEVRAQEGAALAAELRASMLRLRAFAEEMAGLRNGVREAQFERLRSAAGGTDAGCPGERGAGADRGSGAGGEERYRRGDCAAADACRSLYRDAG